MAGHVFLAGLAAEPAVLDCVLGEHVSEPAQVLGVDLVECDVGPWPVAILRPDRGATGVVLSLGQTQRDRLDFVLLALGMVPADLPSGAGVTYLGRGTGAIWGTRHDVRDVILAYIAQILPLQGQAAAPDLAQRLYLNLVRSASSVRARARSPAVLRRAQLAQDIVQQAVRLPYAQFFAIEEYDLSWRRFDGTLGASSTRAAFVSGDAVTVLPYDPQRDLVLVVEQFRAGPFARGDAQSWQIEAIAGRVDPFETPQEAARREAVEEAGLTLADLIPVASYYPTPGAKTEFIYSYVALTPLPDGCAGIFGVADEAEDIRGHLISFDRLMALVASGEISNAPLILTALWLQRARADLRAATG